MMSDYIELGNLINSISKTHKFDKDELVFLNTSDVLEGKILISYYSKISTLKGQAKKTISNGDILYSEIRPQNRRYAYVKNLEKPEDYVVSTKLMVLRQKSLNINTDYLYHFLTSDSTINYLQRKAEGRIGSFPQITFDILKRLKIRLPDLTTQQKIASILSALDDKIELNNKINDNLEHMAKTLYDYWFVQFDFPDGNGKPYKSSAREMVFNEVLKREIPADWEVKSLYQIADTGSGGTPKSTIKEYYENGKIPWINSGELNNPFIIATKNFITDFGMKNSSAKLFPINTILMAMYGATAGKTSIISFESTTNQAVCAVIPKSNNLLHYTKFVLDDMYQYLINLSTGSARDNLSQDKIKNLNLIIPEEEILRQFSIQTTLYYKKIENNLIQNQQLSNLRDWLLPMLMNGQVKVE